MLATLEKTAVKTMNPLDFQLPAALEAHEPPEARGLARDEVRLLVSYREEDRVVHARFSDLHRFLAPGDLLVVNDSAVLPAALTATRSDASELALHLSTRVDTDVWVVEPRQTAVSAGERLSLPAGGVASIIEPHHTSARLWRARLDLPSPVETFLAVHGRPISYSYVPDEWPLEMYQTVYARTPGSVEMPSAGRAISPRVIESLAAKGVGLRAITLHTGVGSLEEHEPPYEEWYNVPAGTARAIASTRAVGGRVVAVGTTVIRALESAADLTGAVRPASGWTELVITPKRGIRTVDGMITGFHEPKASHLSMLEALAAREHLSMTYAAALEEGYLWHEFGDLHLIL